MFQTALRLGCLVFALPAAAQDLVPDTTGLAPSEVMAALDGYAEQGETLDGASLWSGDLIGDTRPDLLVEAAYWSGGNAFGLRHFLFQGTASGYVPAFALEIGEGIVSARRAGDKLELTVVRYLPTDARCCPSATAVVRITLP